MARRCIDSVVQHCERSKYVLVVGCNAVCAETRDYVQALKTGGVIDRLHLSDANINKCPMMCRMFAEVETEFIWWFDDDSYILDGTALPGWLEIAAGSPSSTVMWGHQYFMDNENEFNRGISMVDFVKKASWYRGKEPPSWRPGGRGEYNFEGNGTGDGRCFFLTGGCWMIRASAARALDWPDPALVKCADDILLGETVRQQGWDAMDIGPLGVEINACPRRGDGEDPNTMLMQAMKLREKSEASRRNTRKRGCVMIPTYADTQRLEENFADRPELLSSLDICILDDNWEFHENQRVKNLCALQGWHYRPANRGRHGNLHEERCNYVNYIRAIWENLVKLGRDYEYVVKLNSDSYIIDPDWHEEFEAVLVGKTAIAGTPEYRSVADVIGFWELAREAGFAFNVASHVMHMQAGIYGLSARACSLLREMGFLSGLHQNYLDDCYMSYCCQILGIEFVKTQRVGSWFRTRRPSLENIDHLKAIHPLGAREWKRYKSIRSSCRPEHTASDRAALYSPAKKIPKIGHFVWLGSPLPPLARENIETFKQHHPDWEVRIWTSIPEGMPADLHQAILDAPKMAMRSDIVRLWVVYEHGGIYLDTDVHTLRSMEPLRYYEHFVPWERDGRVNNGIIGAQDKSPVIGEMLRRVREIHAANAQPGHILAYGPDMTTAFLEESAEVNALPLHYFCLFRDHHEAHWWWSLPPDEREEVLFERWEEISDGVPPYAIHLWGIPQNQMPFDLPQSSIVEAFETGDVILRRLDHQHCIGAYLFSGDSLRLASYLLGFHPSLELWLYPAHGTEPPAIDPTEFAGNKRKWLSNGDHENVVNDSLDWVLFDSSVSNDDCEILAKRWLSKLKSRGVFCGCSGLENVRRAIDDVGGVRQEHIQDGETWFLAVHKTA